MHVTKVLHAAFNTQGTSLEESRAFFCDLLGLEPADRPDLPGIGGYWLNVGDGRSQIHLIDCQAAGQGVDPVGNHLCLAVDDLQGTLEELHAAGYQTVGIGDGPGAQHWVLAPSGATIELQQDPDTAPAADRRP